MDVACGTGLFTRQIAPYFDKVVGLDQSAAQLQLAIECPDLYENISYLKWVQLIVEIKIYPQLIINFECFVHINKYISPINYQYLFCTCFLSLTAQAFIDIVVFVVSQVYWEPNLRRIGCCCFFFSKVLDKQRSLKRSWWFLSLFMKQRFSFKERWLSSIFEQKKQQQLMRRRFYSQSTLWNNKGSWKFFVKAIKGLY